MTQYYGVAASITDGPLEVTGILQGGGTTTNGNAKTGYIGEFLTSTVAVGSAVSLTTATAADVTTLALTAGDWDISATIDHALAAASTTVISSGISLTSNTMPTQPGGSGLGTDPLSVQSVVLTTNTGTYSQDIQPVRLSIAATTTVHLVAKDTFSAGAVTAYGTIRARRVR